MSGSLSVIKYIIYIFNLLLLISGILMIVLGAVMFASFGDFQNYNDIESFGIIPVIILVIGCMILVFAIVGCSAAKQESVCALLAYSTCVFIIFVLQLTLVIYIFVNHDDFLDAMGDIVKEAWEKNDKQHGFPMYSLQLNFDCCGVKSYKDYIDDHLDVPNSCCGKLWASKCEKKVYEYRPGCKSEFTDFWQWNINIMGYAGLGVCVVEFVAFALSMHMLNDIRKVAKKSMKH